MIHPTKLKKSLVMYYLPADNAIRNYSDAVDAFNQWQAGNVLCPRHAGAIQRSVDQARAHLLYKGWHDGE